jgi:hypothetical protein
VQKKEGGDRLRRVLALITTAPQLRYRSSSQDVNDPNGQPEPGAAQGT